ncbi:Dps family protein [Boudabousia marimammalium]|uniref:DNA starvation/stationary phase protection protein n=1 Tax=Boudabousia marimammalium TaxID=156892 RepID=A0A1Q5PP45_9ACTO|nr:DNA starvation/stationary phase protection protein [Boudabousia marimammalium]OKL49282.1 DNA starvation/stationary phase protection protein [Boudabousia marimammalium]
MSENLVKEALQQGLVDLTELSLQAKQAHWNIQGAGFQSLHEFLDGVVDEARTDLDEFAERLAAIGLVSDGRSATVSSTTTLQPMPEGVIDVPDGYKLIEAALAQTADTMKKYIKQIDASDPLSADLLIATARELEKKAWMLRMYSK